MYDAVIIGGGHNGLVCAYYLAAAGLKTVVLERRDKIGGAAVTEEFHPGFRNSLAAYTVSLLNPKIIRDLDLAAHGLEIVERRLQNFLPLDGAYLNFASAKEGNLGAEFFSIWVEPKLYEGHYARRTLELIDTVLQQAAKHPDQMMMAYSPEDIEALARALAEGRHRDPSRPAVSAQERDAQEAEDQQDAERSGSPPTPGCGRASCWRCAGAMWTLPGRH